MVDRARRNGLTGSPATYVQPKPPIEQAIQFAEHTGIKHLVTFHHDPSHDDAMLDQIMKQILSQMQPEIKVTPGMEGAEFVVEG